ncbi:MAG: hypothetical protein MUO76_01810 [Anaerolineaceae bacterium]|nr:hypothetical protein [Anaerolineaceae bacterium]
MPSWVLLVRLILPPCAFTTPWTMGNPKPVPAPIGLVVKNGLNTFFWISSGMPVPVSDTARKN